MVRGLKSKRSGGLVLLFVVAVSVTTMGQVRAWSQAAAVRAALGPTPPVTNSPAAAPSLASALATLEEKLAKARGDLSAASARAGGTNLPAGYSVTDLAVRRALLERIVRLYEQQITFTTDLETAKLRRAEVAREVQAWRGFRDPKPYSILLADSLHEGIQLEREEIASADGAFAMLSKLTEEHRTALKQAEEKIRQINEQMEGGKGGSNLGWKREMERLRSQTAAATIAVLDLERQIWQERLAGSRLHLGLLERQLVMANAGVAFTESDVQKLYARFDNERLTLEAELATTDARRRLAAQALEAANKALSQSSASNATQVAQLREQVEVRRAQLEATDVAVNSLRFMLQAGTVERTLWEARFEAYRSSSFEILRTATRKLEQFSRRAALWKSHYHQQMNHTAHRMASLEWRLTDPATPVDLARFIREQIAAWRECDQMYLRVVRKIEQGDRQIQRLEEGLREANASLPTASRVRNAFSDSRSFINQLWDLELFVAQDTITVDGQPITGTRSITLGKILSAIVLVAVGFWLTGLVSRLLEPIFIKRFKIEPNQANLIRRWVRVALIFALALFSMASVKIPLTVFAFAGGALAIGLGFGLQTLLKNFVSGIIILFERPFRVGDVLDVAGKSGSVSNIGIRSSVLQLWDGTETLIPNSTLLENNLTNWTYSNRVVRFNVTVGVAYGSDTRRVLQLLGEIADRHGLIEKEPKPQVLFTNFGANTLDFEMRFWVDVVKANSAMVSSDLRQMIAGTFAENGIVIAYPQRDLHLNTVRPLEVRVVAAPVQPAGDGSGAAAAGTVADGRQVPNDAPHAPPRSGPNAI